MEFRSITKSLIDIKQFKIIKKLKAGGFGVVYLVEEIPTKRHFAAKVLFSIDLSDEKSKKMIDREIGIMMSINNPTLIKIYGFSLIDFHNEPNATIIMEFAKNGSLSDMFTKIRLSQAPIEYSNTIRQIILIGIARGMKYLHDRNIIHRDLSPHNILLDDNLYPIITDFGMAKYFENDNSKIQSIFGGKPQYMSPETIRCEPYGRKSDVYSFAIIMYQVVTDSIPYQDFINGKMTDFQLKDAVINRNYRPLFDSPIKKSIQNLIESCWSQNPDERPTFKEILQKLTDLRNSQNEESCILEGVDVDEVECYIDTITDSNDPIEKLIEKLEETEKELNDLKKQKELDDIEKQKNESKVSALEELNEQLCQNLRRKKSFELNYPSESFSYNYEKILKIKSNEKTDNNDFSITLNVSKIDNRFENDTNITCINIDESVESIGKNSFKGCKSLKQVFIPSSVTSIDESAFEDCTSLRQITIPSSVTNIHPTAFNGCQSLIKIFIPSSPEKAGPFANIDDYDINEHINSGFSNTFKVTEKNKKEEFVLTALDKSNFTRYDWTKFFFSVKVSQLGLPGILPYNEYRFELSPDELKKVKTLSFKVKNVDIDLSFALLFQKFMKNGNVEQHTNKYLSSKGANHEKMNPTIRSKIIFGVACTMKQLHARNVIHRNLKNRDILLDDNLEPRIGSFYFAKFLLSPKEYDERQGTPIYMAPEVFSNDGGYYGFPADVYSFGTFLYMMFTTKYVILNKIIKTSYDLYQNILEGRRPRRPDLIPDHYWNLIQQCWNQDPNERPTFSEITEILKNDKYALEEFGMKTDLDNLHEYQARVDQY